MTLNPPSRLLLGPGPGPAHPRALRAIAARKDRKSDAEV